MNARAFTIFDTAIGRCGIGWTERGIAAVQFPEATDEKTRTRIMRKLPKARETKPTPEVQRAIDGVVALLRGEQRDLADIPIDDTEIPPFNRRVYAIVRKVPPGQTITYGDIAERLGDKLLARDVGQAMGENPTPIIMPCHRVLAANGKPGGFSGGSGVATKLRLLTIEGAQPGGPTLFDSLPLTAAPRR